jgi:AraC-like DNA-binding protein
MRIFYAILLVLLANVSFGNALQPEERGQHNVVASKEGSDIQRDTTRVRKLFNLYAQFRKVDLSAALSYLQEAQALAYNSNCLDKVAYIQYHKGYLYRMQGNYHLAIRSYIASLNYYESVSDSNFVAWLLIDIGNLYYVQTDKLLLAKEHFEKAKLLFSQLDDSQGYALAENNTGMTLLKMNKWQEALPHFFSSMEKSGKINDVAEKVLSLYYIGEAYQQGGKLDSALAYIERSFNICKEKNMLEGIAFGYEHLASLDTSKADYLRAFEHYELAYEKYQELKDPLNSSLTLNKISALYGKLHQYDKAIGYAQRAKNLAEEHNLISAMQEILPLLSTFYSEKQDYKNAFLSLKHYQKLNESNAVSSLKKMQTEYETDIRVQEAALFKKQKELKDAQIYAQQILIAVSVTGSVIFLILFIAIFIRSKQLKESNEMLFKHAQEIIRKEKELQVIKRKEKYSSSLLSEEGNKQLYNNLLELMEQEKIYLNNKLTIDEVAKKINTNRSYLSQMINDNFKTNFNNFINEYRVKEAQRLLLENDANNYSIEGISLSVGFSSKSTFNSAFKKFTGIRPSEFIRLRKKQDEEGALVPEEEEETEEA